MTKILCNRSCKRPLCLYTEPRKQRLLRTAYTQHQQTNFPSQQPPPSLQPPTSTASPAPPTTTTIVWPPQPPPHTLTTTMNIATPCHTTSNSVNDKTDHCGSQTTASTHHERKQMARSRGEQASSPAPTTDLSHMASRCHIAVSDMATKWRMTTDIRHSSSLCI